MIIANLIMLVMEADDPAEMGKLFFWPNQVLMAFYVLELFLRLLYFRTSFLHGDKHLVALRAMDILVVVAGILDQWVVPFMDPESTDNFKGILKIFRILRVFRV